MHFPMQILIFEKNPFTQLSYGPDLDIFPKNLPTLIKHIIKTFSNIGRYGDPLNPWGDIMAVAEAWCVTSSQVVLTNFDDVF